MKEIKARIGHMYPITEAKEKEVKTIGGPSETKDRKRKWSENGWDLCTGKSDAVISDIEEEVLISDKLGGKLAIAIEDLGEGLWRLKSDKSGKVRKSEEPQFWS